jgi:outer membrane receptor protein involved in Fe transport
LIIAPYLQGSLWLGERFLADLGLRYDWAHYQYDEHLGATTDPNDLVYRPTSRSDLFGQLSPKAGLTYVLNDTQALYSRYAHGFRLPAADSLYVLGNGQTDFHLKPETVDAFEVGWKGRVDSTIAWEVDGYWVESRDGIVEGVVTPAGTISTNGGSRRYRGIEVGGSWSLRSDTDVGVAYARTFHEIVRYRSDGPSPQDGHQPAKAPKDLANIHLTHRPWVTWSITLEMQWLGSWYLDDLNTARTPNEFLFHLRTAWQLSSHWSVDGKILNLFDSAYASTAERFAFGDRYRPGQPFTATMGVTWNY